MEDINKYAEAILKGYDFEGESLLMGAAKYGDRVLKEHFVRIPLVTMNRHGLIAGATGTGKTKTLQILAELLSERGVPSLVMDIKGDLSGIAAPSPGHPKIDERMEKIGFPFTPSGSPVEFLTLSDEKGVRLRATVSEFGPVLFSKLLELNDTQAGIIAVIFKFCDDQQLPLLDLKDMKKALQFATGEGKEMFKEQYGRISTTSVGTILRKIIELEQQGAEKFFGEISFEVDDLCRFTEDGRGVISVLRLVDIQDRPKLFSTFMLQILAEIYNVFPEEGDMDRPKLCIFIDEAHLVFDEASDALMDKIEVMVKLIRSKGVGLFFVTQNPTDIPDDVLSQLGLKIQHALRAFTAKDRKAIRLTAQNYPETPYFKVDHLLTELGIGEALITALDEKGIPTPLAHTYLRAPQSRMDVLTPQEIDYIVSRSYLVKKYNQEIDRESAYEILTGKIEEAQSREAQQRLKELNEKATRHSRKKDPTLWEKIFNSTTGRQVARTFTRELTRGLLGGLGVRKTTRRSRRRKGWF